MTGYIGDDDFAPISLLTVRSLRDLGYSVNLASADPFGISEKEEGGATTTPTNSSNQQQQSPPTTASSSNKDDVETSNQAMDNEEQNDDVVTFGNDVLDSPRVSLPTLPKHVVASPTSSTTETDETEESP